jgi:hypothetical protein
MTFDLSFLQPWWVWGGLMAVSAFLVLFNLPRNLVASVIVLVTPLPGAWAIHESLLAVGDRMILGRIFGAVFAVAALMLFAAWAASAWALVRRVPLHRPVFLAGFTLVGLALLGTREAADILIGIIFLLGE